MDKMIILQSDLKKRQATDIEQEELDRRTQADEPLFDTEPEVETQPEVEKEEVVEEAEEIVEEEEEVKEEETPEEEVVEETVEEVEEKAVVEEPSENILEAQITEYATEKNIDVEEARKVIEGEHAIAEKYGKDPLKLARAYRERQSMADKDKAEASAEVERVNAQNDAYARELEKARFDVQMSGDFKIEEFSKDVNGKPYTREDVVNSYRKAYPSMTAESEDDAVYDMAKRDMLSSMRSEAKANMAKQEGAVTKRKVELLETLSDDVKPFIADIKNIVDKYPAEGLLQMKDLEDVSRWARGNKANIESIEKEAEERGYKRAMESKKILGEKKTPTGQPKVKTKIKDVSLTDKQKEEALNMFERDPISEEKKYEHYKEILDHDKAFRASLNKKEA